MNSKQRQFSRSNNAGFTLIELTVTIALFAVLAIGLTAMITMIFSSYNKKTGALSDEDQARKVAAQITNELRNVQIGNDGSYSLGSAGDQEIIFYSNLDKANNVNVSRIRYFIQNGALYRGEILPTGSPQRYTGPETIIKVQDHIANGASPLFEYYTGSYDAVTSTASLAQPVNLNQVKFVRLVLKVYIVDGNQTSSNYYTVYAGAALRNLKNNLGN